MALPLRRAATTSNPGVIWPLMRAAKGRSCCLWVTGQALSSCCAVLWPQMRVCTVGSTALCRPFWLCWCCFWCRTGGRHRASVQFCAILQPTTTTRNCETDGDYIGADSVLSGERLASEPGVVIVAANNPIMLAVGPRIIEAWKA